MDEALLRMGDYHYYGFQPMDLYGGQSTSKAAYLYRFVEQRSKDQELKSQALFNLGLIYHFGSDSEQKVEVNLDHAQAFYKRALDGQPKQQAPIYLMFLYSKWQSIDLKKVIYEDLVGGILLNKPSNVVIALGTIVFYFGFLLTIIRYLREETLSKRRLSDQLKKEEDERKRTEEEERR
mmetsp:Transcript_3516/g.5284  ORF Transcript_3516/g.5284 Transcript_3516/m.5284 type:complete len:179 (+) Transcript_3516:26-562(+)